MCKWGTNTWLSIGKGFFVDSCIADDIIRMNEQGIETRASCCGHSKTELAEALIIRRSAPRARELGYSPKNYYDCTEHGLNCRNTTSEIFWSVYQT